MANTDYTPIEAAVIAKLLSVFTTELTAGSCKAGDVDAVLESMFINGGEYACFLEFGGGREDYAKPFTTPVWLWTIDGVFLVKYVGQTDTEARLRTIVSKLATLFAGDHTLGGVTPLAKFVQIDNAEPSQINDTPFYWLPFTIEVVAR